LARLVAPEFSTKRKKKLNLGDEKVNIIPASVLTNIFLENKVFVKPPKITD